MGSQFIANAQSPSANPTDSNSSPSPTEKVSKGYVPPCFYSLAWGELCPDPGNGLCVKLREDKGGNTGGYKWKETGDEVCPLAIGTAITTDPKLAGTDKITVSDGDFCYYIKGNTGVRYRDLAGSVIGKKYDVGEKTFCFYATGVKAKMGKHEYSDGLLGVDPDAEHGLGTPDENNCVKIKAMPDDQHICPNVNYCWEFWSIFSPYFHHDCHPPTVNTPTPNRPQCAKLDADGACLEILTSLSETPIATQPGAIVKAISLVILSLAGGISVILIIIAGYKILTSNGKPEAVQAGREQLTSALVGLLFIIFSYVIFQFIVADLLKIPGITN